jgi:uncharacterized delta-60 repeat protein
MTRARVVRVLLAVVVGVAAWCVVGSGAAVGAPGDLDTSFSTDGIVTTDIGGGGRAVAVDSQDRVVVAGTSFNGSDFDFSVVRYTSAGVLDTSFSADGIVVTDIGSGDDYGYGVVVDSQDRVVVAGQSDNSGDIDFAVVRYTSAGVLDATFGTGGKVTTAIGSTDGGQGVVVDSQDRIVVAGYSFNSGKSDFAVARYTSAGELDTSFSADGIVVTDIGSGDDYGRAVAVDSQDRVVVAGASHNGSDNDFAVVRYTSAGELDTSFSADGIVTTAIGSASDYGYGVVVDSDDRVVVAGVSSNGSDLDFAVVRYTSAGVLDATFGTGGKVTTAIGDSDDRGQGVVVDSQGRIVVAGYSYLDNIGTDDFVVVRYTSAGVLDASFGGGDGVVTTAIGPAKDHGLGVVVDSQDRVVVAGWSYVDNIGSSADFAVVRYVGVLVPVGCTIVGTSGPDVLVGTGGDDHICGLGGNDRIYGKAGNDTLDGGPGNDRLFGQGGNDKIYGMGGNDTLDGGAGEDTLFGQAGADTLRGGTGRDTLYGGASNDRLYGGEGGDVLFGRGGADVLKGGPGNDRLYGQSGRDVLYGRDGNDRLVGGSHSDRLFGQSGWDTLYGGRGNDMLVGGIGDDTLYGQRGRDRLSGGMGRDFLSGGPSYDKLNGGPDADTAKAPGPDFLVSIEFIVP